MIGKNQCEHGSLARSCRICELEVEIARLTEEVEHYEHNVALVYDHVTHGLISKINTDPQVVMSVADDVLTKIVEEETVSLTAGLDRMRPVVESVKRHIKDQGSWADVLATVRALDVPETGTVVPNTGTVCPDCVDGIAPKGGNEGSTRYVCPTCNGDETLPLPCPDCGWTGEKPCPTCKGRGYFGSSDVKPCPMCGGCGFLPTDTPHTDQTCQVCGGTGMSPHGQTAHRGGNVDAAMCQACGGTGRKP